MQANTRAAVAYIAGRIITGKEESYVYDYSIKKYISISGEITIRNNVNVYDYEGKAFVSGDYDGNKYELYHYGNKHHIQLEIKDKKFEGYDYGEKCHFSGDVDSGGSISLYDYGVKKYFNYSV